MGTQQGLSSVRNRTIDEARGRWIFFADGDDLLSDHFVETALSVSGCDADLILHDRLTFLDDKGEEAPCAVNDPIPLPADAGRALSLSVLCLQRFDKKALGLRPRAFYHAAWGALYRRDFLEKTGLRFPPEVKKAQDSVFNGEVYCHAKKIAYLPRVMYYYRNNPQGITKRYCADYEALVRPLIAAQRACLQRCFPGDRAAEDQYIIHRVISFLLDGLRLDFCHPDNKKPKAQRKKELFAFAETAPFRQAIDRFDPDRTDRPDWAVQILLLRKRRFAALDFLLRHAALRPVYFKAFRLQKKLRSLLNRREQNA